MKDSPEQCHHISCSFLRVSKRQWEGFCRAAERARPPARPFNRVNGKAALQGGDHLYMSESDVYRQRRTHTKGIKYFYHTSQNTLETTE